MNGGSQVGRTRRSGQAPALPPWGTFEYLGRAPGLGGRWLHRGRSPGFTRELEPGYTGSSSHRRVLHRVERMAAIERLDTSFPHMNDRRHIFRIVAGASRCRGSMGLRASSSPPRAVAFFILTGALLRNRPSGRAKPAPAQVRGSPRALRVVHEPRSRASARAEPVPARRQGLVTDDGRVSFDDERPANAPPSV